MHLNIGPDPDACDADAVPPDPNPGCGRSIGITG